MPSLDAIRHPFSQAGERRLPGMHGRCLTRSEAFKCLMNVLSIDTLQDVMPVLERFVVLMYDRSSICMNVNDAHKELFVHKGRSIESIPPTADALFQHSKRSVYQSGYCWRQCLVCVPELPSPSNWGWQKGPDQTWQPIWTNLPQASQACQEMLRCSCKAEKGCRQQRCKCFKADLPCTALCKCGGDCDHG